MNILTLIKNNAFSFLFADLCYFCRRERALPGECACTSCHERMPFIKEPYCVTCGRPFITAGDTSHTCGECIKVKRHYDKARSVFVYDNIIRNKIIEYKFMRNITLARAFCDYMQAYIAEELNGEYDTIIPVPLHKKRLKERCFNQALLLAENPVRKSQSLARNRARENGGQGNVKHFVSANWRKILTANSSHSLKTIQMGDQITVDKYSLKRIKYTTPQVMLKGRARLRNVRGAFTVTNDYNIKRKRVLVVDDIFTTGATVDECAKVLKNAGAARVDVLTLAKTGGGYEA